jgi:hypothetical protein
MRQTSLLRNVRILHSFDLFWALCYVLQYDWLKSRSMEDDPCYVTWSRGKRETIHSQNQGEGKNIRFRS